MRLVHPPGGDHGTIDPEGMHLLTVLPMHMQSADGQCRLIHCKIITINTRKPS